MIHMECQVIIYKKKKKLKPSSTAVMIDVIPTSNFQLIRLLDSDININSNALAYVNDVWLDNIKNLRRYIVIT